MDSIAIPFLLYVLLFLPGVGIYSWHYLQKKNPALPKKKGYRLAVRAQIWLLVLTLVAAAAHKIILFPPRQPSVRAWLAGAVFLCAMQLRVGFQWRFIEESAKDRMRRLLPEDPVEFWYWVPVGVLAGVGEECAYRGVAYLLLVDLLRSAWLSLAICTVAFAVAHVYQGWKSSLETGVLGFISQIAVFLTGSLYLSIAVHAAYNVLLGWLVMRFFLNDKMKAAQANPSLS